MLKKIVHYTDFNGADRKDELYFNLTEIELTTIQAASKEGIEKELQTAVDDKDVYKILEIIKLLIHKSYGIKSADGRYFEKSPEILHKFLSSAAYDSLMMDLFTDGGARGAEFIQGLMPADLVARATAKVSGQAVPSENMINPYDVAHAVGQSAVPEANSEVVQNTQALDEDYLAWKKQREEEERIRRESSNINRPPHESGPGFYQQPDHLKEY